MSSLFSFLGEHGVDLLGAAPGGGAVLGPIPGAPLVGGRIAQGGGIEGGADQNAYQAAVGPADGKGVFQRRRQAG